jgi:hypothetical protein
MKTMPGLMHNMIATTDAPSGSDGIPMNLFSGAARSDRWLISVDVTDSSTATKASLDLGSVGTGALDTIVRAKTRVGSDGDVITVRLLQDVAAYIEEDHVSSVTIRYIPGVTTVAQVEAMITSTSNLIEVGTIGTPGTVLQVADAFVHTPLADGVDGTATFGLILWARESNTKNWGRVEDVEHTIVAGRIVADGSSGRFHRFLDSLGNFDRVYFQRTGADGVVTCALTEIFEASGN